jgi:hypothetical protein
MDGIGFFRSRRLRQGHRESPGSAACGQRCRLQVDAMICQWAGKRLNLGLKAVIFFSIVDAINPRKNLEALLRVFAACGHGPT